MDVLVVLVVLLFDGEALPVAVLFIVVVTLL